MSRSTRNPKYDFATLYGPEERRTKQLRGQSPPNVIVAKSGKRVGTVDAGGSKSKRVRQWKRIAKRRASKRRRHEALEASCSSASA